jgi:hypothetical protein
MSNTNAAPSRKPRVLACEVCRGRRTRCDGKKPKCSSCEARGVECVYPEVCIWPYQWVTAIAHKVRALSEQDSSKSYPASSPEVESVLMMAVWNTKSPRSDPSSTALNGLLYRVQGRKQKQDMSSPPSPVPLSSVMAAPLRPPAQEKSKPSL